MAEITIATRPIDDQLAFRHFKENAWFRDSYRPLKSRTNLTRSSRAKPKLPTTTTGHKKEVIKSVDRSTARQEQYFPGCRSRRTEGPASTLGRNCFTLVIKVTLIANRLSWLYLRIHSISWIYEAVDWFWASSRVTSELNETHTHTGPRGRHYYTLLFSAGWAHVFEISDR